VHSGWLLRQRSEGRCFFAEVSAFPGFSSFSDRGENAIKQWVNDGDSGGFGSKGALGFAGWSLHQSLPFQVSVNSAGLIQGNSPESFHRSKNGESAVWKVKIGVADFLSEQKRLDTWLDESPETVRFRLDANGQLDVSTTSAWLNWIVGRERIEFLEQPLPVGKESLLLEKFGQSTTRIALDESVVHPDEMSKILEMGWPGWLVVKPALFGNPGMLFEWPDEIRNRTIISSAFETGIGFSFVLKVASMMERGGLAHGLGTRGSFGSDGLDGWPPVFRFEGEVGTEQMEKVFSNEG